MQNYGAGGEPKLKYGHLLQNRYESINCEEDVYFMELIEYIHLNLLEAKSVMDMSEPDWHCCCGRGER